MRLRKNYILLRFLNKKSGPLSRFAMANLAWALCFLCTLDLKLALILRRQFSNGNKKQSFRLCGWILKRSVFGVRIIDDDFFDFTNNRALEDLDILEIFLKKRKGGGGVLEIDLDILLVKARRIHLYLELGFDLCDVINDYFSHKEKLKSMRSQVQLKKSRKNINRDLFNVKEGCRAINDLKEVLPINIFPWFIIAGTFLGQHREGGFIKHDYDIDLGIFYTRDTLNKLILALEESDAFDVLEVVNFLEVTNSFVVVEKVAFLKIIHETGINIDLFMHYDDGLHIQHYSDVHGWYNKRFEIKKVVFQGIEVLAPSNPDEYLAETYGDWWKPVYNYNYWVDMGNIYQLNNYISDALFFKVSKCVPRC